MRRAVGLVLLAGALAGCGSSAPKPPHGGPTLRLAIVQAPQTLDPARAADLVSLNVAHELYAGLTRFAGRGVEPDLAESWEPSEGGLVWTFHLRKGLRWSDGTPITARDFRRSWLRALAPATATRYAGPVLGIVRGARHYHATNQGGVGVETPDERTLRVTLRHPVPWFDQLAAYPITFPAPPAPGAFSGPFRLAAHRGARLVLARNLDYWNAAAVKPRRIVLTTRAKGVDAILPRGLAGPGLPWIETASSPSGPGWEPLETLSVQLLWLVTRGSPLADPNARAQVGQDLIAVAARDESLPMFVPRAMPGFGTILGGQPAAHAPANEPLALTLAYTTEDPDAAGRAARLRAALERGGVRVRLLPFPSLRELLRAAGPPARPGIDLVLLGWSAKIFDAYNIFDLFPCGSAFNVADWCDRDYGRLMGQAVRTLDDDARWRLEARILQKLDAAIPALPLGSPLEHVYLKRNVRGFAWSPIGFYELMGMTRS